MSIDANASGYALSSSGEDAITLDAKPEPIQLKASETAVIIVDMQNAYASKDGYLDKAGFDVSATGPVIANINKTLTTARAAGMTVVFFQNGWDPQYREAGGPGSPNWYKSNALKTMRKNPELDGTLLARGGWDYELVDALKPEPTDLVLGKTRYSGFYNTPLDSLLRARHSQSGVYRHRYQCLCRIDTARWFLPGIFRRGAGRCHSPGRTGIDPGGLAVQHRNLFWLGVGR